MLSVGISINGNALTGVQSGLQQAVGSIEGTINNEFFFTIAIMFIGIFMIVSWVTYLVLGKQSASTFSVPIRSLVDSMGRPVIPKDKLERAGVLKVTRAPSKGFENKPIEVTSVGSGRFQVRDGIHRTIRKFKKGQKTITAKLTP